MRTFVEPLYTLLCNFSWSSFDVKLWISRFFLHVMASKISFTGRQDHLTYIFYFQSQKHEKGKNQYFDADASWCVFPMNP